MHLFSAVPLSANELAWPSEAATRCKLLLKRAALPILAKRVAKGDRGLSRWPAALLGLRVARRARASPVSLISIYSDRRHIAVLRLRRGNRAFSALPTTYSSASRTRFAPSRISRSGRNRQ